MITHEPNPEQVESAIPRAEKGVASIVAREIDELQKVLLCILATRPVDSVSAAFLDPMLNWQQSLR